MSLNEHMIECVLDILSDERVSKQLHDIVNTNVKGDRTKIIVAANEKQKKMSDEITLLKKENEELKRKYSEISKLCSDKEDELIHKNEWYNKSFCILKKPLSIYESYKSLPEGLRHKNLNFISDNSLFSFVSTGTLHLERFWDFIKEELLEDRTEYTDKLKAVFDFFFDMKNDIEQLYVRNECGIGDAFNYDKHIMTRGGQNLGAVSEILFLGFSDKNGKMIRKTVVRISKN